MNIRLVKKTEWEKLKAFNSAVYRPDHILTNKKYFDWQFDGVFNADKDNYSVLGVFNKKEELLGTFGFFVSPFNFFGQTVMGNSMCNLIVKEEVRSLGYGYLLLKRAADISDVVIDHGINDATWPLFERSGFRGEDLKRFFYIINEQRTKELIGDEAVVVQASKGSRVVGEDVVFGEIKVFDGGVDNLWDKIKDRYPVTISRSSLYLNWRYSEHPLFDYKVFVARSGGEIGAVAVVRVEEPENKFKVAHLVDFFATEELEEYALGQLVSWCEKERVDWLDYFFSGGVHMGVLKKLDFQDGDISPYDKIPMLLNPIERTRRTKINFAYALNSKNLKEGEKVINSSFYTTKGGGDQDRPN